MLESDELHGIWFTARGNGFVALQIVIDGSQVRAKGTVRRGDATKVLEGEQSNKTCDGKDTLLDRVQFQALAKQPCAKAEVDSVEGELDLGALLGGVNEEQVVVPVHKNAGSEVMEATGTSRPKFFGSTQGT